MAKYARSLLPYITPVTSNDVSDGAQDFECGALTDPVDFFLDNFHFFNGSGDPVAAGAGTVIVTVSSDGTLFRTVTDDTIDATVNPSGITPPSGRAAITHVRLTLSSVTGVSGFRFNIVKGGM